jgi:hypothetical protein
MEHTQKTSPSTPHRPEKSLMLVVPILLLLLCSACTKSTPPDYDLSENMAAYMQQNLTESSATARTDMPEEFTEPYVANLKGLMRLVFGNPELQIYLNSYESEKMAVTSISQFEVPPDSGNFLNCAFVMRPAANIRAPLMHGDAGIAMAGMGDSLSMDFYNVANDEMDVDVFFGDQIAKIEEGLSIVEQYQRTGEDRGEYTRHLDPFKSNYRIEIEAPDSDDEAERKTYFDAALAAYKLFIDAYFTSLERIAPENDQALIESVKAGTETFIKTLKDNDFTFQMGGMIFGNDFEDYYTRGFWREGYYGQRF